MLRIVVCLLGSAAIDLALSQIPVVTGQPAALATLRYIDVAEGEGASAGPGMRYTVHYTGWLANGAKFDSSRDRDEPFSFVQGRRQVIAGWEAGFEGMKTGGRRRLFIPYQLAYGERGNGPIPPKSELIFDVELLKVEPAPEQPAAIDLLVALKGLESKVTTLAKAVPADKWEWRPSPGVRSFAEVFRHIAFGNRLLAKMAVKGLTGDARMAEVRASQAGEKKPLTQAETLKLLDETFAEVRKLLTTARAGNLTGDADFFGEATTNRGIFVVLETHVAEHLGQAIAYARMNGIAPPWSTQ